MLSAAGTCTPDVSPALSLVGACTDFETECLTLSVPGWVGPSENRTRPGISKHVPFAISAGTGIPKHATTAIRPSPGNSKHPPPVTYACTGLLRRGVDERGRDGWGRVRLKPTRPTQTAGGSSTRTTHLARGALLAFFGLRGFTGWKWCGASRLPPGGFPQDECSRLATAATPCMNRFPSMTGDQVRSHGGNSLAKALTRAVL